MIFNKREMKMNIDQIEFRELSERDIPMALEFELSCYERLKDKEIFIPESERGYRKSLKGGLILGAFFEGQIVGAWNLTPFGEDRESYGYDLGLESQLDSLINFESAIVEPSFRGIGIDKKAVSIAVEALKKGFRYFACTVSPSNPASIKAMLKNGFLIKALKEKYGGHERFVLLKDIKNPRPMETSFTLEPTDKERIKELLDEGYLISSVDENNCYVFSKLIEND